MSEITTSSVPYRVARQQGRPDGGCTLLPRKVDLLILCARIGFRP
jgi:hypothetical protein